jgi:hypothetical protein
LSDSKIIDFNKAKPTDDTPTPEVPYNYEITLKDGHIDIEAGLLSFNPIFAGIVTEDGKLLYATPMDNIRSIRRLEPA